MIGKERLILVTDKRCWWESHDVWRHSEAMTFVMVKVTHLRVLLQQDGRLIMPLLALQPLCARNNETFSGCCEGNRSKKIMIVTFIYFYFPTKNLNPLTIAWHGHWPHWQHNGHTLTTDWPQTDHRPATHWPHTDYTLTTYWPHTGHRMTTHCQHGPHTDHRLTTQWPQTDHRLTTHRPHTDHTLTTHWPLTDHSLITYWPHPDQTLSTSWPRPDHTLTTHWPQVDHTLTTDWPASERARVVISAAASGMRSAAHSASLQLRQPANASIARRDSAPRAYASPASCVRPRPLRWSPYARATACVNGKRQF